MFRLMSFEDQRDTITTHAWEAWTNNGLLLDDEDREQTTKSVQDAVTNTYVDGIDEIEWLNATLKRLRGSNPRQAVLDDYYEAEKADAQSGRKEEDEEEEA